MALNRPEEPPGTTGPSLRSCINRMDLPPTRLCCPSKLSGLPSFPHCSPICCTGLMAHGILPSQPPPRGGAVAQTHCCNEGRGSSTCCLNLLALSCLLSCRERVRKGLGVVGCKLASPSQGETKSRSGGVPGSDIIPQAAARRQNFILKILKEQKQPHPHPMHSLRYWMGRASVCFEWCVSTPGHVDLHNLG